MAVLRHPSNLKAFVFSHLLAVSQRLERRSPGVLRSLLTSSRFGLLRAFLSISPAVPVDLSKGLKGGNSPPVIRSAFLVGLLFSLFGTAAFCAVDGTLLPGPAGHRAFLEDGWNLFLYVFITPTYVALASGLIVLTVHHWGTLAEFGDEVTAGPGPSHRLRRLGLALTIGFGLCSASIANYMYEVFDPGMVDEVYWFIQVSADGVRSLNHAGYYYVALNFALLYITLLGIASFFTLSVEVIRIGNGLKQGRVTDFALLRQRLDAFTRAYILGKWLAAVYMVNAFVWKYSPLGGESTNLKIAGGALTAVGVFFLAVPRLYVEVRWFQFMVQASDQEVDDDLYRDIRPQAVRLWAQVLDVVLIGGFVVAFWELDLAPAALIRAIESLLSGTG